MSIEQAFENPNRLVAKSEVKILTNYSDASLWRLEHLPGDNPRKFPPRIRLSRNRVYWRQKDVVDWIDRQQATPANTDAEGGQ